MQVYNYTYPKISLYPEPYENARQSLQDTSLALEGEMTNTSSLVKRGH
jgi:hypothetical protein